MKFVHKLNISQRLGLSFGLVICLIMAVAGVGFQGIFKADKVLTEILQDDVKKLTLANSLSEEVHVVARVIRTVVLLDDASAKPAEVAKIETARVAYDRSREALRAMPSSASGAALLARIDAAASEARAVNNEVLKLAKANQDDQAIALLLKDSIPKVAAWQGVLDEYATLQHKSMVAAEEAAHVSDQRAMAALGALTSFAVLLGVALAWWITRSITGPLATASSLATSIRDGDLTTTVQGHGNDETGRLLAAMHEMQLSIGKIVSEVRINAESVATASAQIAQGNLDLSERTEQQASSLQETAATMEQLSTTVRQNADNAQQANQLAQAASDVAIKGGEVVGQVVATMKGISDSSRRIADIIGTIDGIAFQTNILALNAAVEAARAGEQGRGFAVVASEVRSLAQRSAEAAKEIKTLISASVERVEQGTVQVGQAGQTMDEVVNSIRRVTDIVGEISSASAEQSSGIGQVGQAVNLMDQATQQNAALVEESAAAAESLKSQASALVRAVGVFKLTPGEKAQAAAPEATPWDNKSADRRGPARAKNVARPAFGKATAQQPVEPNKAAPLPQPAMKKTGTDDDWTSF